MCRTDESRFSQQKHRWPVISVTCHLCLSSDSWREGRTGPYQTATPDLTPSAGEIIYDLNVGELCDQCSSNCDRVDGVRDTLKDHSNRGVCLARELYVEYSFLTKNHVQVTIYVPIADMCA